MEKGGKWGGGDYQDEDVGGVVNEKNRVVT
jgi:hypothetical protein